MSKSLFSIAAFLLCLAASLPAVAGNAPSQPLNVAGRWNVSWQARLGTEQAEVELQQDGSKLSGTFHDPHHTCVLSGTIEGKSVSFNVNFTGPRPYTIAFKGTLDGDKIGGISQAKNIEGAGAYLGHGGEIVQPEHPWTAIRPANPPTLQSQEDKAGTSGNSN